MTIKQEATKLYRLLRGTHVINTPDGSFRHVSKGENHPENPVVPLTDTQYKAFKDKFVPAGTDDVADKGTKLTGPGVTEPEKPPVAPTP